MMLAGALLLALFSKNGICKSLPAVSQVIGCRGSCCIGRRRLAVELNQGISLIE